MWEECSPSARRQQAASIFLAILVDVMVRRSGSLSLYTDMRHWLALFGHSVFVVSISHNRLIRHNARRASGIALHADHSSREHRYPRDILATQLLQGMYK